MKFRFARHTNNLENLINFYVSNLGFELLGKFENHDGYNGAFLGKQNENWHIEFTQNNEIVNQTFDDDAILVFYPENKLEFDLLINKITQNNIQFIEAKNPYWNHNGKMLLDPDGYRIVISNFNI